MKIRNGAVVSLPNRKPYEINAKGERGEIYLYDVIGDSWEGTTGKQFAEELRSLGDVATLDIYINSPGGSVFDGLAIYNVLARHKARKNVLIDGIAASIASVVAMAGDEITIAENGMMMIHNPWGVSAGEADDFRRMADMLDKVRDTIVDTYVGRSGHDREDISSMMASETWMTADEAIKAGLADKKTEPAELAALAKHDLSNFEHAPDALTSIRSDASADASDRGPLSEESEPVVGADQGLDEEHSDERTPSKPHPLIARAAARLKRRNLTMRQ